MGRFARLLVARQRYSIYLEDQKKNKVQNGRSLKRKQIQEEITAVNKKKAMLENTSVGYLGRSSWESFFL